MDLFYKTCKIIMKIYCRNKYFVLLTVEINYSGFTSFEKNQKHQNKMVRMMAEIAKNPYTKRNSSGFIEKWLYFGIDSNSTSVNFAIQDSF